MKKIIIVFMVFIISFSLVGVCGVDIVHAQTPTNVPYPYVVSIIRSNANPVTSTAWATHFFVTFSEGVTGVDKFDFQVITTGGLSATISSVGGTSGTSTRTVYVTGANSGYGVGTLGIYLIDNDTIKNSALVVLGGAGLVNGDFLTGEIYDIYLPTPTPTSTPLPLPTSTDTPLPLPTSTDTPLPLPTSTDTPLPLPTSTDTPLPLPTVTNTPIPLSTATPSIFVWQGNDNSKYAFGFSLFLVLMQKYVYAVAWLLMAVYLIPPANLKPVTLVLFIFLIIERFRKAAKV